MRAFNLTAFIISFTIFTLQAQDSDTIKGFSKNWLTAQSGIPAPVLQTRTGLLLYNNSIPSCYTVRIDNVVSLEFPVIEIKNGNYIEHSWRSDKRIKEKGCTPEDILNKYMDYEWQYIITHTRYGNKIKIKKQYIYIDIDSTIQTIDSLNFWYYDIHKFEGEKPLKIKTVFYMDGYFNNYLLRFTYYSKSGLVAEAEKDLIKLFKNIKFYLGNIDIDKLEAAIKLGKYFYEEPSE